ncbi:MAG: hypothetical protein IPL32_04560 [Chloracidobacterium sp.]|nr:hypothetical protein [Chloracidobacterium sp.]
MSYEIDRKNEDALHQQHLLWICKVAIGTVSGLLIASATLMSFSFSWLTTGVLVVFALLAAWISTTLRD